MRLASVLLVLVSQLQGSEGTREPWSSVMHRLQAGEVDGAQALLEQVGGGGATAPSERAHAWQWAGVLALKRSQAARAARDFEAARRAAPESFEARMATVHLGELAMQQDRWGDAERELASVAHDPDPIVLAYASARLQSLHEHALRRSRRVAAGAWLGSVGAWLLARLVQRRKEPGIAREVARALLVTEGVAIVGGLVVPRVTSSLAASGWMAFALPMALVVALTWATRTSPPHRAKGAAVLLALALTAVAGLYLALDLTWWAVE